MTTELFMDKFEKAWQALKIHCTMNDRMSRVCKNAPHAIQYLVDRYLSEQSEKIKSEIILIFENLIALADALHNGDNSPVSTSITSNVACEEPMVGEIDNNPVLHVSVENIDDALNSTTVSLIRNTMSQESARNVQTEQKDIENSDNNICKSISSEIETIRKLRGKRTVLSVQNNTVQESSMLFSSSKPDVLLRTLFNHEIDELTQNIKTERESIENSEDVIHKDILNEAEATSELNRTILSAQDNTTQHLPKESFPMRQEIEPNMLPDQMIDDLAQNIKTDQGNVETIEDTIRKDSSSKVETSNRLKRTILSVQDKPVQYPSKESSLLIQDVQSTTLCNQPFEEMVQSVKNERENAVNSENTVRNNMANEVEVIRESEQKITLLSIQNKIMEEPWMLSSLMRCEVQLNMLSDQEIEAWTYKKVEKKEDSQIGVAKLSSDTDEEGWIDVKRPRFRTRKGGGITAIEVSYKRNTCKKLAVKRKWRGKKIKHFRQR